RTGDGGPRRAGRVDDRTVGAGDGRWARGVPGGRPLVGGPVRHLGGGGLLGSGSQRRARGARADAGRSGGRCGGPVRPGPGRAARRRLRGAVTTPTDPGQGPFAPPYQPSHPPQVGAPAQEAAPSPDGGAHPGSTPHLAAPVGQASQAGRRPRRILLAVAVPLMAVCLLAGLLLGVLLAPPLLGADTSAELPTSQVSPGPGGSAGGDLTEEPVAAIAADVLPSTVYIEVAAGQQSGSGSGLVLREDGYIVTNQHVIAAARDGGGQITVVLSDGSEHEAEIVGASIDYDLAVLQVDADGLRPLVLGDSDGLVVGEPVVAIGAPLGLEGTVTSGIVSALNRPVSIPGEEGGTFINAIQTDAAINPGNSGGPLVNAAGEVIGVNSAIATTATAGQAGSVGLGFAIPSSQVRRTTEQLIETGQATYPVIG